MRLTANGQTQTQPITIKMDPRVKITPEVQQIFTLTTQLQESAMNATTAYKEARALADKLKTSGNSALIAKLEELAPVEKPRAGAGGGLRRRIWRSGRTAGSAEYEQYRRESGGCRAGHARVRNAAHRGAASGMRTTAGGLHGVDGQVGRAEGFSEVSWAWRLKVQLDAELNSTWIASTVHLAEAVDGGRSHRGSGSGGAYRGVHARELGVVEDVERFHA